MALTAHPEVEAASSKVGKGGQVDLDAVGLGKRVQEDAFLNQVQVQHSGQVWEGIPDGSFVVVQAVFWSDRNVARVGTPVDMFWDMRCRTCVWWLAWRRQQWYVVMLPVLLRGEDWAALPAEYRGAVMRRA